MEISKNILIRGGIKFTKYEKIGNSRTQIVSEDESIKIPINEFINFEIICSDCGKTFSCKLLRMDHIKKLYLCRSCCRKGERSPNYGRVPSDEEKEAISKALKGKKKNYTNY